jgi:hypothetical protein
MGLDAGVDHLFDHEAPPGAALDRQRHVVTATEPLGEPGTEDVPGGRPDLARAHLTGFRVQIVERGLCPNLGLSRSYTQVVLSA